MLKVLCFACCLFPFFSKGQTTHSVSVLIGQGTECPEPLHVDDDKSLFQFYPNPAEETITILTDLKQYEVRIYTLQGKLVFRSYQLREEVLDIQSLAEGTYLLEVHSDFHSESRRIQIQR